MKTGGQKQTPRKKRAPVRIDHLHYIDTDEYECSACGARFRKPGMTCPGCGARFTGTRVEDEEMMEEMILWDDDDDD